MAHWLWLSSTAWLKVPSSSRSREDPIERGKLRSVNLLQRTRARPDSIHVWADRGRDHPEEFISQPHRWPYFFHHNGPVSHRHRHLRLRKAFSIKSLSKYRESISSSGRERVQKIQE